MKDKGLYNSLIGAIVGVIIGSVITISYTYYNKIQDDSMQKQIFYQEFDRYTENNIYLLQKIIEHGQLKSTEEFNVFLGIYEELGVIDLKKFNYISLSDNISNFKDYLNVNDDLKELNLLIDEYKIGYKNFVVSLAGHDQLQGAVKYNLTQIKFLTYAVKKAKKIYRQYRLLQNKI